MRRIKHSVFTWETAFTARYELDQMWFIWIVLPSVSFKTVAKTPSCHRDQNLFMIRVFGLPRRQNCVNCSRTDSRVNCLKPPMFRRHTQSPSSGKVIRERHHFPWGWRLSVSPKRRRFLNIDMAISPRRVHTVCSWRCPAKSKISPSVRPLNCASHAHPPLFTLFPAYFYQKKERALPGNLQSSKLFCLPP
jgi:hypothetical protein